MAMKTTFEKTVSVLVKAYLNDTLSHGSCAGCAVGNLVKAQLPEAQMTLIRGWATVFMTPICSTEQHLSPECYIDEAKDQIDSTGYTWQELARIEKAFELESAMSNNDGRSDDEAMFKGLMAVVDVLADIHGIDLDKKESAKLLFIKV